MRCRTITERRSIRSVVAIASIAFSSCMPFEEPGAGALKTPQSQQVQSQASVREKPASPAEKEQVAQQKRKPSAPSVPRPMELNARMIEVAGDMMSQEGVQKRIEYLFKTLKAGASGGVKPMSMAGRPPRTASEALAEGGDCTELALIVASILKGASMEGGVQLVHFKSSPKESDHMIAYALVKGKKVVIDLQADRLGKTKDAEYEVLMDLPLDKAHWMYHREIGDHAINTKEYRLAISAYEKAATINPADAYVQHNLAVACERAGEFGKALSAIDSAVALNGSYSGAKARIRYNAGMHMGAEAFKEKRYADCADGFQMALDSGEKMSADERKALESNRDICRKKAGSE